MSIRRNTGSQTVFSGLVEEDREILCLAGCCYDFRFSVPVEIAGLYIFDGDFGA